MTDSQGNQEWRRAIHVSSGLKLIEDGDGSDEWRVFVWQGYGGLGWYPIGGTYGSTDSAIRFINAQRSGSRPL